MARTEVHMQAHMNCALSYRFLTKNFKSESTFALERRAYYFHLPRNGRQLTARALGGPDAPPPPSHRADSSRCLISIIQQIGHPQEAGLTIMCTSFPFKKFCNI